MSRLNHLGLLVHRKTNSTNQYGMPIFCVSITMEPKSPILVILLPGVPSTQSGTHREGTAALPTDDCLSNFWVAARVVDRSVIWTVLHYFLGLMLVFAVFLAVCSALFLLLSFLFFRHSDMVPRLNCIRDFLILIDMETYSGLLTIYLIIYQYSQYVI